ncbi:LexA family protein [Candidatus Latescibacterota bacterium]
MDFKERLNYMMKRRDIANAAELSRMTGLTQVAIRNYMRGIKVPNAQALIKLSKSLHTTADYLLTGSSIRPDRIPLLSKIPGGVPVAFTDGEYPAGFGEEFVDRGDVADPNAFALIVEGESMCPRINSGDIVIISPNAPINSRCIAAVTIKNEEHTLKRIIFLENGKILLQPENDSFDPLVVDMDKIKIIGRVIERRERL